MGIKGIKPFGSFEGEVEQIASYWNVNVKNSRTNFTILVRIFELYLFTKKLISH